MALFCAVSSLAIVSAHGQVVPAATSHNLSISAGALGSMFQPDYDGLGIAYTSPNRLYGPGAFVDVHFSRWLQVEAEGHWLRYNQYYWGIPPTGNGENTYLIGPRIPIVTFHRITPYGKFLVGMGSANFLMQGDAFVLDYGGGVDYRLTRRFTLRAIDFEYQQWRLTPVLSPYGGSVGISYKIF
ncbi:MAG: outer membrane beta-barrel protein [Terracidiphilus sp.]